MVSQESPWCEVQLEVLQLQDASGSFARYVVEMNHVTTELLASLGSRYKSLKYGMAGFIDKPLPFRGLGKYGGSPYPPEWCYELFVPLTSTSVALRDGLHTLRERMSSGGDYAENPLEAMIFGALDSRVGWSSASSTEEGIRIVKILLVVTDNVPHLAGDAYKATALQWNAPRIYPPSANRSLGGFGAHSFIESGMIFGSPKEYLRMADLFAKLDTRERMTVVEKLELVASVDRFGPYPWPPIRAHPGDDSLSCEITEYPSPEQVGKVMAARALFPIFLLPSNEPELLLRYEGIVREMNVTSIVAPMDSGSIAENIVEAVSRLTKRLCTSYATINGNEPKHSLPTTAPCSEAIATPKEHSLPTTEPSSDAIATAKEHSLPTTAPSSDAIATPQEHSQPTTAPSSDAIATLKKVVAPSGESCETLVTARSTLPLGEIGRGKSVVQETMTFASSVLGTTTSQIVPVAAKMNRYIGGLVATCAGVAMVIFAAPKLWTASLPPSRPVQFEDFISTAEVAANGREVEVTVSSDMFQ